MTIDAEVKAIKLELKLNGVDWTDVTADVRAAQGIDISKGMFSHTPADRVAGSGRCGFTLDNSEANSAGLLGYYSPDHANGRSGFELNVPVRVSVDYGMYYGEAKYGEFYYGASRVRFLGKIKQISVESGEKGMRSTACEAFDFMYEMSAHKMNLLALQESRRSDLLFGDVIGNMDVAPEATNYQGGQEVFAFGADNLKDEKSTALAAAKKIAVSELGYVYELGDGTLVFEDRHHRVGSTPLFTLTAADIMKTKSKRDLRHLYNYIEATSYPRDEGSGVEVLWTLRRTLQINANSTETIVGRYVDPNQLSARISGKDLLNLVGGTDYKFGSTEGSGTNDKEADLTVTETFGANSTELVLENTSGTTGYVNLLQVRGTIIRIFEPVISVAEDSTSKTAYGKQKLELKLPYQDSPLVADDFATSILADTKDPRIILPMIGTKEHSNIRVRALSRLEIGDRLTLSDTMLGISEVDYFVHGINLKLTPPNIIEGSWSVVSASAAQSWLLGLVGFGELGSNTILGT